MTDEDLYDLGFIDERLNKKVKGHSQTSAVPMNFEDNKRWSYMLLEIAYLYSELQAGDYDILDNLNGKLKNLYHEWSFLIKDTEFFNKCFRKTDKLIEIGNSKRRENAENQRSNFGCIMYPIPLPKDFSYARRIIDVVHYELMNKKGIFLSKTAKEYANRKEDKL